MGLLRQTWFLLRKELLLEYRQRYAISGIFLYVFSTVFVVYISALKPQPPVWNTLFWIIVLFTSINALVKSFVQESSARQLYYYSLVDPLAILISKTIYNTGLLALLSGVAYGAFRIVAGDPVRDSGQFMLALGLGSLGLGICLTFVSAIANKTNNSATLLAILGFPLIIPILLELLKLSANALRLLQDTAITNDILILLAIDALLLGLGLLLFPFLWRD